MPRLDLLEEMADYLEKTDESQKVFPDGRTKQFHLNDWCCNTTACAIGFAGTNPRFNDLGLYIRKDGTFGIPIFQEAEGWEAVTKFFEFDEDVDKINYEHQWINTESYLFNSCYYPVDATKQDVVNRIRNYIKGKQNEQAKEV